MSWFIKSHDLKSHDKKSGDFLSSLLINKGLSWSLISLPNHYHTIYTNIRRLHSKSIRYTADTCINVIILSYSVTEGLIIKKCISSFLSEYRCYPPPTQLHINQLLTLARHFLNRVINLSSLHLSPPFPLPFLFNLSSTFFYLFYSTIYVINRHAYIFCACSVKVPAIVGVLE